MSRNITGTFLCHFWHNCAHCFLDIILIMTFRVSRLGCYRYATQRSVKFRSRIVKVLWGSKPFFENISPLQPYLLPSFSCGRVVRNASVWCVNYVTYCSLRASLYLLVMSVWTCSAKYYSRFPQVTRFTEGQPMSTEVKWGHWPLSTYDFFRILLLTKVIWAADFESAAEIHFALEPFMEWVTRMDMDMEWISGGYEYFFVKSFGVELVMG